MVFTETGPGGAQSQPGKTAPRLIEDLLHYDLRSPYRQYRSLLADPASQYHEGVRILNHGPNDCRHALIEKEQKTKSPPSNDRPFVQGDKWTVKAHCYHCLYHFDIVVDYPDGSEICQLSREDSPLHHLLLVRSENEKQYAARCRAEGIIQVGKVAEYDQFVCSSQSCRCRVRIKISEPRLPLDLVQASLLEGSTVYERGRREIRSEPERYAGLTPLYPLQALSFLRTYIGDAQYASEQTPPKLKKISKRNKKYMLVFANDCDDLFEYLGFKLFHEESDESSQGQAAFWKPVLIEGSNKEFFEDVMLELESLIQKRPPAEQPIQRVSHRVGDSALHKIELSLGYHDYPTRSRSRTVDLTREEHPYYASLGARDTFTDQYLIWAYDRQCETDFVNKPYYLDCLKDLAKGRQSDDLQTKVVMATSAGEYGLSDILDAYRYFSLDPGTGEGDEHIIGIYRSRIQSAPRQKEEAKQCLLIIAKARDSAAIEAVANDNTMSYEEALEFLNVNAATDADSIEAAAVAMSLDYDKHRIASALRVIGANRTSAYSLFQAAAAIDGGTNDFALNIRDAYKRLDIKNHSAGDDTVFAYYTSLSNGAAAGSKDSYAEALRTIAHERKSAYLLQKLEDPNADVQADMAKPDQPVGLENIGNTCYLNSLLQYFYTIRPVREVIMNIEDYRMALSADNLSTKRSGGRVVSKAEVIKGQKFMEEMHDLFENLKVASTRSVKPTRELAELSFFGENVEESIRRDSIVSPHGPPNQFAVMKGPVFGPQGPPPPIPTRPPPETIEEDIEMVEHPGESILENGYESEVTLVDLESSPNGSDRKDSGHKTSPSDEVGQDSTSMIIDGNDANEGSPKHPSPPENPPPIPPRNKAGLSIQTTEDLDDKRWRFGTQQDVDEVIKNTTFRMMCAIKPTAIDPQTGEQIDQVRDTFYGDSATYLPKAAKTEKKVESWSSIVVYAVDGKPIDIYEALDTVYDEQEVVVSGETVNAFAAITKLPPVLQIQINRTIYKSGAPFKIKHAVNFPETIYLDRYMDAKGPDSVVSARRKDKWKWKAELRNLEARLAVLQSSTLEQSFPANKNNGLKASSDINVTDALLATKDFVATLHDLGAADFELDSSLPELLDERISSVALEIQEISGRISDLQKSLSGQFADMRKYEYKLQAVFIHRGEAGSGHYWIYIYDFHSDIWREYNDEYVTIVSDRKRVFEQDTSGATPYYLAYVRSSDRENLVDPVCRDMQLPDESHPNDTVMQDEFETGDDEQPQHVEYADHQPLQPKPLRYGQKNHQDDVDGWGAETYDSKYPW